MARTMYIDHEAMKKLVTDFQQVSDDVTNSYKSINNIVQQVTNNDSWRGVDSDTFLDQFETIRSDLERHIEELNELSPTMSGVDTKYSETQEENAADIKNRGVTNE